MHIITFARAWLNILCMCNFVHLWFFFLHISFCVSAEFSFENLPFLLPFPASFIFSRARSIIQDCARASGPDLSATATGSFQHRHAETACWSWSTKVCQRRCRRPFLTAAPRIQDSQPEREMSSVFISCPGKGWLYFFQRRFTSSLFFLPLNPRCDVLI